MFCVCVLVSKVTLNLIQYFSVSDSSSGTRYSPSLLS